MQKIFLDTNALIALSDPGHELFQIVEAAIGSGAQGLTCAIAWHEYVRGPLLDEDRVRALQIIQLDGRGIVSVFTSTLAKTQALTQ